jgi:SET domain-containing protein
VYIFLIINGYQIDEKVHRSPYGRDAVAPQEVLLSYFINHCCDGNMWYTDSGNKLVAIRDIALGEEINYDYALTETNPQWVMYCRCNKGVCRYLCAWDLISNYA